MQRRIGELTIESIAAESSKFAAPIVLIHGLWCSATVWRRFMGYLAHRGWDCHAVNLRGHGDAGGRDVLRSLSLADYLGDLECVIAACDAAPVLVGHDVGGLLALACSTEARRAVVALAPLLPGVFGGALRPALSKWTARVARLRSRSLPPPRGKLGTEYFAPAPPGGTTAESLRAPRELSGDTSTLLALRGQSALLLAGEVDRFCPPDAVERLARQLGAQFQEVGGAGHALPWGIGWEKCVAVAHRWLIQTLGEPLLLLGNEEDA